MDSKEQESWIIITRLLTECLTEIIRRADKIEDDEYTLVITGDELVSWSGLGVAAIQRLKQIGQWDDSATPPAEDVVE